MTGIFAQLPAGQPGLVLPEKQQTYHDHLVDVPVLDTPEPPPAGSGFLAELRFIFARLTMGSRDEFRHRARALQLLLTVVALATIRPQFNEPFQWTTLLVLVHTFVFSAVLLLDKRCCGVIVRRLFPQLDWRTLERRYTCAASCVLYVLFFGLIFAHKGYGGYNACNWVSITFTLLTGLAYAFESWLQLRDLYDGRPPVNN